MTTKATRGYCRKPASPGADKLSFSDNPKQSIQGTYRIFFVHHSAEDFEQNHTSSGTIKTNKNDNTKLQGTVKVSYKESMLDFGYDMVEDDNDKAKKDETAINFAIKTLHDDHELEIDDMVEDGYSSINVQAIEARVACPWIPDESCYEDEDYADCEISPVADFMSVLEADEMVKQFEKANQMMASTENNCPALFFEPGGILLSLELASDHISYFVARKA
jgi:hypothetical protein